MVRTGFGHQDSNIARNNGKNETRWTKRFMGKALFAEVQVVTLVSWSKGVYARPERPVLI